jgi:hypothetical protein
VLCSACCLSFLCDLLAYLPVDCTMSPNVYSVR